jgi:UDP-N-acetylglucosamine 2-epimerase
MKILTVVGARPQFIKAAPVCRALRAAGHTEVLVHTGQHYDHRMSQVFFDEMGIPAPDLNLGVGSGSHAQQTGEAMIGLERAMLEHRPDCVLVYGDTNSTLAGALAACKLRISLAHVEAGLRSYNRAMPEEHNRVITDHCADLLLCPTRTAVDNLAREGITRGVHRVGDTMFDAVKEYAAAARARSDVLGRLGVAPGTFLLATVHRASNTDDADALRRILTALAGSGQRVVFPVHPRTRERLASLDGAMPPLDASAVQLVEPVSYLDMLVLQESARAVLTDSGGMQKEAFFLGTPCITLREETEWVETVEAGWNVLVGTDTDAILDAIRAADDRRGEPPRLFGEGDAAERIAATLAGAR